MVLLQQKMCQSKHFDAKTDILVPTMNKILPLVYNRTEIYINNYTPINILEED